MSQTPAVSRYPAVAPIAAAPTRRRERALGRPGRWLIALIVAVALLGGALGGYFAYRAAHPGLTRGQIADAERWQAQADAYRAAHQGLTRGLAADAARWQAQADAWMASHRP